jgi:hypothetical protein
MEQDATFTASKDATFFASPDVQFNASLGIIDGLKRIVIRGVCLDCSVNRNNWQVPEDELEGVAKRSVNAQIRLDHSQSVRDVKGKILKTEVDEPHDEVKEPWDLPNKFPHIHYEAELITNEANIIIPILQGYVDHVSIGVDSKNVHCSNCGEATRPGKTCECEGAWEVVHNARVNEYSFVCSPAYENTYFKPYEASEKTEEKAEECDCKDKKECEKIEKTDRIQEVSSEEIEDDQEVASIENEENQFLASENTEENNEEITEKDDDVMVEDETKLDSLIEMVSKLSASYTDLVESNTKLVASNNELLSRIAAIEDEEEDKKKASEEVVDGGEKEASEEEDEGCGKKKASKKKASNGMKETPGERGDPEGEEKKEIKKSPIEAGIVINTLKAEVKPVDSMGLAISEVFKFAATKDIYPLE